MSVHAVLILAEPSPLPDLVADVRDAHDTHDEALPDQSMPFSEVSEDAIEGIVHHIRGLYRYNESEDIGTLLDDLEAAIPASTGWHAIYFHVCDHDIPADIRGGCSWESSPRRAAGSIPLEVRP